MTLVHASSVLLLGALLLVAGCDPRSAPASVEPIAPVPASAAPAPPTPAVPRMSSTTAQVRVTAAAPDPAGEPAPPPGATALCHDGTYSIGRRHPNACARHGGVARWL
jgi:serine/threonine-protein kinase